MGPRAPFSPHHWASSATQEGPRLAGDQAGWALSGPNTTPCSCSLFQPVSAWADGGEAARGRLRTATSCVPDPRACASSLSPMNTSFVLCTRHHANSFVHIISFQTHNAWQRRYHNQYSHFTHGQTEAQRGTTTQSKQWWWNLNQGESKSRPPGLFLTLQFQHLLTS